MATNPEMISGMKYSTYDVINIKRLMGKSLLSMTSLQNVFHLSIGKTIFGGLFISSAMREAYFFPLNLDEYAYVRCMITVMPARRLAELLL